MSELPEAISFFPRILPMGLFPGSISAAWGGGQGQAHGSHFTDGETKARGGEGMCPRSKSPVTPVNWPPGPWPQPPPTPTSVQVFLALHRHQRTGFRFVWLRSPLPDRLFNGQTVCFIYLTAPLRVVGLSALPCRSHYSLRPVLDPQSSSL